MHLISKLKNASLVNLVSELFYELLGSFDVRHIGLLLAFLPSIFTQLQLGLPRNRQLISDTYANGCPSSSAIIFLFHIVKKIKKFTQSKLKETQ